jgi:hypothetical protein
MSPWLSWLAGKFLLEVLSLLQWFCIQIPPPALLNSTDEGSINRSHLLIDLPSGQLFFKSCV